MNESNAKLSGGFPAGLRVLAVDDDDVVLRTLERLLLKCGYKVTVAHHALDALKLLRTNENEYDLIISDVNMPYMDGFKLLEIVGLEMDLPVIMLSVDCDVNSVMKGIMHGAVDYLVKPVRIEELKLIWKHVARRSVTERNDSNNHPHQSDDAHNPQIKKKLKNRRKERDGNDSDCDSDGDIAAQKKPRITWTIELHAKFINAVNHLGLDRAVPKKILDFMNIPGLTRENVASHLQKYRKGLKRNGVGVKNNFDKNASSSIYGGSFLFTNSSDIQQHRNGNSLALSKWFPHPLDLRQYSMDPQPNHSIHQHRHLRTNIYPVNLSYNYHSLTSQNHSKFEGISETNSIHKLGSDLDQQNYDILFNSNLFDKLSNDLEEIITSEQDQHQFGSCTTFEDDHITNPPDDVLNEKTFALKKDEYLDDLHAALEQFKRHDS